MKLRNLFLLGGILTITTLATTAQAESKPVPYRYGMPLDIRKVIAMNEPNTPECKVITADIKFLDKAGEVRHVSYQKLSDACMLQN
ncbi:DUF2790 domain-containing protein [Pseudomonas sp. SDO5271_S396]